MSFSSQRVYCICLVRILRNDISCIQQGNVNKYNHLDNYMVILLKLNKSISYDLEIILSDVYPQRIQFSESQKDVLEIFIALHNSLIFETAQTSTGSRMINISQYVQRMEYYIALFLKISVYQNHVEHLLKHRWLSHTRSFWFSRSRWVIQVFAQNCAFLTCCCDADTSNLRTDFEIHCDT